MPITFTRIVRTGLSRTVSTPAIAAQVDDVRGARGGLANGIRVEDVGFDEGQVRVLRQLAPGHRIAVQIVERDHLVVLDEASRQRRADEARPAGQEDALSGQRHGGESSGANLLLFDG